MAEIREVPAPDSAATPEHTMSPEGAARLAALEAGLVAQESELKISAGADTESPAEPTDPQAERVTPPAPTTSIAPLEGISEKYEGVAREYQEDLAAIADEHPSFPPGELSTFFHFIGSRAAAGMAREEQGATLYNGQAGGPNLASPEECRSRLLTDYGDMANAEMNAAKSEYDKLPAKVKAWIDADQGNGRRLGNHPDVVLGLALRPFAKLSSDAAAKELETIRQSADYQTGNKLSVAKAAMLQLVVSRGKPEAPSAQTDGRRIISPKPGHTWGSRDAALPTQGTQASAALRAELSVLSKSLYDQKGELAKDPKKRKSAIARRAEIQTQLGNQA